MSVQTAPKAVSTISRDAIVKAAPGGTFVQMIDSIPGVNASTDDVSGLANGNYQIRGFTSDEIGTTVNGAPINDSGNYKVYSTEYGDTENMGDITVLQGYPDVDTPISGAAGGAIAWVTIDPSHTAGLDFAQSLGNHDYRRTFLRFNTGDIGPVRSWLSYSNNTSDFWRGPGDLNVTKVDGKSLWTIDDNNYDLRFGPVQPRAQLQLRQPDQGAGAYGRLFPELRRALQPDRYLLLEAPHQPVHQLAGQPRRRVQAALTACACRWCRTSGTATAAAVAATSSPNRPCRRT